MVTANRRSPPRSASQVALFDDARSHADPSQPQTDPLPLSPKPLAQHAPPLAKPAPAPLELAQAPLAHAEVLSLEPRLLGDLPLATTLVLRARVEGTAWHVTTGREMYASLRAAGELVLTGAELGALAVAARAGRASREVLAGWAATRRVDPSTRLDLPTALGGVELPRRRPRAWRRRRAAWSLRVREWAPYPHWPLSRVLLAWALELEQVGVGDGSALEWLD